MIWMAGLDMGCFYFNRAWLDYRGRTLEQEFGNGWAEGVHPEDLDRCVQHYISSFERRASFAMSYRLQDHRGEFHWILDRGVPHYAADGTFLGFYGGCAETPADSTVARVGQLREALQEMRVFAERLAEAEACTIGTHPQGTFEARAHELQNFARHHAVSEIGRLATDMITYGRIEQGACLR